MNRNKKCDPPKIIQPIPVNHLFYLGLAKNKRNLMSFDMELTARCNNNCRHCYINLPTDDKEAEKKELSFKEITRIIDEAGSLGALWCLLTGGEPLLRKDFFDIYLYIKKKGLFVSVFTNATLINHRHIGLFKRYPPRDIEISVYGVTRETYEKVTRKRNSYEACMRGINLLLSHGIKVRFKAMALQSNVHELARIKQFCKEKSTDYFRFDPFLNLRFDRDEMRNNEIRSERLSPEQIVSIEQDDDERSTALRKECKNLIVPNFANRTCKHLFHCGAGTASFHVGSDGRFRLCSSLLSPDCTYDLRDGSLREAWEDFVSAVRRKYSRRQEFVNKCRACTLFNLCSWCPGHAYLESGRLDSWVKYFCDVAHARAEALLNGNKQ